MKKVLVKETNFSTVPLLKRGKVRDIYDIGEELLLVATDRISAFDVVMPDPIPDKGTILTRLSLFWFDFTRDIIQNHIVASNIDEFPEILSPYKDELEGRAVIVKKAKPLPIECIVRGYISGSGWKEYQEKGSICGHVLPEGLKESEKLPSPIFTPSTKAEKGEHDINITVKEAEEIIGKELAKKVEEISLTIYKKAYEYAIERGIIIADTKFEFGLYNGDLILIDELLTPDSSRFWPLDSYEPGRSQVSFDKQFLRDYLIEIGWDKSSDAPKLPENVIKKTHDKYVEALKRLTGQEL